MRPGTYLRCLACLVPSLIASARGLTFTQPAAGTIFSSTLPNTVAFTATAADPPLLDLYLSSTANSFGPTHLRLLASSVSASSRTLTFTAGGIAILPPGDGYTVIAVRQGARQPLAVSRGFRVIAGAPPAVAVSSPSQPAANISTSASSTPQPTTVQSLTTVLGSPSSPSSAPSTLPNGPFTYDLHSSSSASTSSRVAAVTAAVAPGGTDDQGLGEATSGASVPRLARSAALLGAACLAGVGVMWM